VCDKSDLEVEPRDDGWIHVSCPQCKLDFEGLIANPEEAYTPGSGRKIRDPFG
jgi:phage FluMu protein Com